MSPDYCVQTVHLVLCGHDHEGCGNYRAPDDYRARLLAERSDSYHDARRLAERHAREADAYLASAQAIRLALADLEPTDDERERYELPD